MKKILTQTFAFLLLATWSIAQCTLGTTTGSECTLDANGTITMPTLDDNGNAIDEVTIVVKAWGAGGGSNTGGSGLRARAGGGGGAYYTNTYTVAAGASFTITVGQPIAGNVAGGSSIFDFGDGDVIVGGGFFGSNSGGAGGTVTGAIAGGTATPGGTGGARNGNAGGGGGGGGSGPTAANGGDGDATTGGAGGADGGTDGGNPGDAGIAVTLPGGGAGGTGDGTNLGQNPGGVGQVIVCFSSLVLPVELVRFNANVKDDRVLLEWQTASEVNNEGFEIQKSKDGKAWDMIEFVKGNGSSSVLNTYTSIDRAPNQGSNFYRLKQMDIDGRFEYSNIAVVDFNNRLNEVELFPNPAMGQLTLINGEGKVYIYNALGETVKQLTIGESQTTISLADLLNGQYYLQVIQEDGTVVSKQFTKVN